MQVFISHISEEKALALVFKDWIESTFSGTISVFVSSDPDDIPAGTKWLESINGAITKAKLLIVIYSPLSRNRPWINFEAGCGWVKDIPIMPICHSGLKVSEIGAPISSFHGLEIENEGFIDNLISAICKHAGLSKTPRIDKSGFSEDIRTALDSILKPHQEKDTIVDGNAEISLSEVQVKILKMFALCKNTSPDWVKANELALIAKLPMIELRYHLIPLLKAKYIYETSDPNLMDLTDKGITYLGENGHLECPF